MLAKNDMFYKFLIINPITQLKKADIFHFKYDNFYLSTFRGVKI